MRAHCIKRRRRRDEGGTSSPSEASRRVTPTCLLAYPASRSFITHEVMDGRRCVLVTREVTDPAVGSCTRQSPTLHASDTTQTSVPNVIGLRGRRLESYLRSLRSATTGHQRRSTAERCARRGHTSMDVGALGVSARTGASAPMRMRSRTTSSLRPALPVRSRTTAVAPCPRGRGRTPWTVDGRTPLRALDGTSRGHRLEPSARLRVRS